MEAFMIRNRDSGLYLLKTSCRFDNSYQWAAQARASIWTNEESMSNALRTIKPGELINVEIEKFKLTPIPKPSDEVPPLL